MSVEVAEQTGTLSERVGAWFSAQPEAISWPYPLYEELRRHGGVYRWEEGPATFVTRYDLVRDIMAGVHPTSQDAYRFGELSDGLRSRLPVAQHESFYRVLDFEGLFMSRNVGDSHLRLRRIAARAFTGRRVEMLRSSIEAHVDDLISDMAALDAPDFKRDLADKLPVRVITDLLGVPREDIDQIWAWSSDIANLFSLGEETLRRAERSIEEFRAYINNIVERVRTTGEGPELAQLLLGSRDQDGLSEDELVAMYLLILFGGSETTTNLLGNGFYALQRHRAEWDVLVDDPLLVRGAVEELLRYDTPHHYLPRVVEADFELAGTVLRTGQTVVVVQGAANRDPDRFVDPDTLDVRRHDRADHLSFAFGAHHCLGSALARLEGEVVFRAMVTRYPHARLLTEQPHYHGSAMLRAIDALPVDLGTPA